MYTVERSSQAETFPFNEGSHSALHDAGAAANAEVSYSSGFGPHMNGTPKTFPSNFTSGISRSLAESCAYAGNLEISSGAARPVCAIDAATSLDGEITS